MSAATQLPPESERDLHKRVADLLALAIGPPGIANRDGVWWSTIEHAERDKLAAIDRARRGVAAGLPDILVLYRGIAHWIELKRAKGGRLSEAQNAMIVALSRAGCPFAVCRSCVDVLAALAQGGVPYRPIRDVEAA